LRYTVNMEETVERRRESCRACLMWRLALACAGAALLLSWLATKF
jgi:hypothetical protein